MLNSFNADRTELCERGITLQIVDFNDDSGLPKIYPNDWSLLKLLGFSQFATTGGRSDNYDRAHRLALIPKRVVRPWSRFCLKSRDRPVDHG